MGVSADIKSLNISSSIDTKNEIPTINISVNFSNTFSNTKSLQLLYWLKNNEQVWISLNRADSSQPFTASVDLSKFAASGEYEIRSIRIYDNTSTLVVYNSSQLKNDLNLDISTFISNPNSDNSAPTLDSVLVGQPVYTGDSIHIPFKIKASDALSGLRQDFIIELLSPSGKSIQARLYFDDNGEYSGNFQLERDSPTGDYKVNTIRVYDLAGNASFSQVWLQNNINPIYIESVSSDDRAPELKAFRLSTIFNQETEKLSILITGIAEDQKSGVQGVYLRLRSESGDYLDTWVYYSSAGERVLNFENYKTLISPGKYAVDFLRLTDVAGNQVYFYEEQLAGAGFSTFLNVIFPPTVTIKSSELALSHGESALITFTLSEPSSDFLAGDVVVSGGTLINFAGSGSLYTAIFVPNAAYVGSASISVSTGRFTDLSGNANVQSVNHTSKLILSIDTAIQKIFGTSGNDTFIGGSANFYFDGGDGVDTVVYNMKRSDTKIVRDGEGSITVTTAVGANTLISIERLNFDDMNVAFDIDGAAGNVARILGIVFGAEAVSNKEYVGIGLDLLDKGMSFETLTLLAIQTVLGQNISHESVVNLLYFNAAGYSPPSDELATYVKLLENGTFTYGSLGVMAANHELNEVNIGLIGLTTTGLDYLPVI